jgi:hypothetical protein
MMKFDPKGIRYYLVWMLIVVNARVWFDMKKMSGKMLRSGEVK